MPRHEKVNIPTSFPHFLHRDYDYILLLDKGEISEIGTPFELLQRPQGHFASMVDKGGVEMSRHLRSMVSTCAPAVEPVLLKN